MSKIINNNIYVYVDEVDHKSIVFNKNNFILYNIPFIIGSIINDYIKLNDEKFICDRYNINANELENLINRFNLKFNEDSNKEIFTSYNPKVLKVLRLIISNTCNLKCKYCYADEGTYKSNKLFMETHESKQILDELFKHFDVIEEISFFGGEPLLNIKVIEFVCKYLNDKFNMGEIIHKPRFSLVTNGTLINDKFIKLVNEYKINITISVDGPKDINDELRIDKSGKGKFDTIKKNVFKLKKDTIEPSLIECTYTGKHIEKGYNIDNLHDFLRKEFDVKTIFINTVDINSNNKFYEELKLSKLQLNLLNNKDLENSFNKFLESDVYDSDVLKILTTINNKNKKHSYFYCNAGIEQLSINTNGDIYPCQLFIGLENNKFYMGNILKDGLINNNYKSVKEILLQNTKFKNKKCIKCSEKYNCNSCIGVLYKNKKTLNPFSNERCSRLKENNNKVIREVIKLYTDERKYKLLTKKLKEFKNYYAKRGINL